MAKTEGFFKDRNQIGQKRKPWRMSRDQRSILCDAVERAVNSQRDGVRIFWDEDLRWINVLAISYGDKTKIK